MQVEKFYIINQHMIYMESVRNQFGKLITKVHELDGNFLVDCAPLKILDDSIKLIGFDFRGAKASAKWILDDMSMCPVMVNPILGICVFPDRSITSDKTIWFNPNHIVRTTAHFGKTKVEFTNGQTLEIQRKLSSFNHKLQAAEQLKKFTVEVGKNPTSFIQEPHKKNIIINISTKKHRKKKKQEELQNNCSRQKHNK